jgi:hypothetical protein
MDVLLTEHSHFQCLFQRFYLFSIPLVIRHFAHRLRKVAAYRHLDIAFRMFYAKAEDCTLFALAAIAKLLSC